MAMLHFPYPATSPMIEGAICESVPQSGAAPEDHYGWDPDMAWVVPKYTKRKVNWAGDMLSNRDRMSVLEFMEMEAIINNWRSAHNFPLNTFHIGLKKRAIGIDPTAITAQRI